jgi:hypothetical protein
LKYFQRFFGIQKKESNVKMTEIIEYKQQIIKLKYTIHVQDVLLLQCMKYINTIKSEIDSITKPTICFGKYQIVKRGSFQMVNMTTPYDCEVVILTNTETNLFELYVDELEKLEFLREIRFNFGKKYIPGVSTTIHLVKHNNSKIKYVEFIAWCSCRNIRLSMTIGGCPVSVDWKYVFYLHDGV